MDALDGLEQLVAETVNMVLRQEGEALGDRMLSVVLTNDEEIQQLNAQYRGKDKPTNVLAFPSDEEEELGDILVAFETVKLESQDQHKAFKDHVIHLLVHAVLHLLGYDHEEEGDANLMESKEISILSLLAIANPYE